MKYLILLDKIIKSKVIYFMFIFSIMTLIANAFSQDFLIPCYYCHMDVIVEMKSNAAVHWESDVGCEVCHGPSREHLDVEDNSIKPDRIWTEKNVHELCKECHQETFTEYIKSAHGATVVKASDSSTVKIDPVNCSTCHGYHQQKNVDDIWKNCIQCHTSLPQECLKGPNDQALSPEEVNCRTCHDSHTLTVKVK